MCRPQVSRPGRRSVEDEVVRVVALTAAGHAGIDPAPLPAPCLARILALSVRSVSFRGPRARTTKVSHVEAHLPASQPQSRPYPRLSCPHGNTRWPQDSRRSPASWSEASERLDRRQMRPEGFPATLRVKKRREFLRIQGVGGKHHLRHFLVFVVPPASRPVDLVMPARLGVTVTRKVGCAVVRNRIKRFVREAFRRKRGNFTPGYDMVWVAKQSAAEVGYAEVLQAMDALSKRPRLGVVC